jgi:hypothetical protein
MWFKQYGYSQNPFMANAMKEKTDMIGRKKELEDAIYYVSIGSMFYLQSSKGNGKTKFLKSIIDNFKGKIIYVDALKLKKNLDIEELLRKKNGFIGSMFSDMPKNMILLLDNSDELSMVNFERLKFFFDNNFIRSIVFTGNSFEKSKLPESIKHRISNRVIKLPELDLNQVVEIINDKLETTLEESIIGFDIIKKVYDKEKNLKKIMLYLDMASEEMISKELEKITIEIIDSIMKFSKLEEEESDNLVDDDGNTIEQFGEYYRNPSKDIYCSNCGAIVDFTDDECPECGLEFEKEVEEEEEEKEKETKKNNKINKKKEEKKEKEVGKNKIKKKKSKSKNKKVN